MYGFEALSFNIKHGYLGKISASALLCTCSVHYPAELLHSFAEGIVRGHKAGLLKQSDYNNLCQCESLDDVKLHLVSI